MTPCSSDADYLWKPARQLLTLGRRTCDAVAECCEGCQATRTLQLVQAMRSANVRADAIVFNSALSAYARNRLTLWKPRALAAARHARAAPSDTRNVAGAGDKLSQRARRRDRVKLGGECVRAQPAAAADARARMPRFKQR